MEINKEQLKKILLAENQEKDLNLWFDPLSLSRPDKESVEIHFPHQLFFEWFRNNFKQYFEQKLKDLFGTRCKIIYFCNGNGGLPAQSSGSEKRRVFPDITSFPKIRTDSFYNFSTDKPELPSYYEGKKKQAWTEEFSFESFIYNRKNHFPVAAAKNFAGGQGPSPFIMHAGTACGKTHLLYAICAELMLNVPENSIFIGTLSDLRTIIDDIGNAQRLFKYFSGVKYFLIDNFQDCGTDKDIQRKIIQLMELEYGKGAKFALCLDCPPSLWDFLHKKLRSTLESGLIIEIKKPDLEIKNAYTKKKCEDHGLSLKNEDILKLSRVYNDFRQIHGAIHKITAFQTLGQDDAWQDEESEKSGLDLEKILKYSRVESFHNISPQKILETIAGQSRLDAASILGKSRSREIVSARHILVFLCRDLLKMPFGLIGSFIGKDHSSVLYSFNKISKLRSSDKDMNKKVTELSELCLNGSSENQSVRK